MRAVSDGLDRVPVSFPVLLDRSVAACFGQNVWVSGEKGHFTFNLLSYLLLAKRLARIFCTFQTFCSAQRFVPYLSHGPNVLHNRRPHGGQEGLSSLWAWPLAPRRAWWGSEEHPRPEEGLESTLERRSRFWWAGRQPEPPNAAIWMLPRTPIVHRCDQSGFSRNLTARLHPCSHCALARVAL